MKYVGWFLVTEEQHAKFREFKQQGDKDSAVRFLQTIHECTDEDAFQAVDSWYPQ